LTGHYTDNFSDNSKLFGLIENLNGRSNFWYNILQIHDTHGLPFDLIWLKLKETGNLTLTRPDSTSVTLDDKEFIEFMEMTRYGADAHGIGLDKIYEMV